MPYLLVARGDKLPSTIYVLVIALLRARGVMLETDIHESTSGAIDAPPTSLPPLSFPSPRPLALPLCLPPGTRYTFPLHDVCAFSDALHLLADWSHFQNVLGHTHRTPCNYSTLVNTKYIKGHTHKHDFSCANMQDFLGRVHLPLINRGCAGAIKEAWIHPSPVMSWRFPAGNCSRWRN